jgi:tetratricopeptide (TPR) repeat protein
MFAICDPEGQLSLSSRAGESAHVRVLISSAPGGLAAYQDAAVQVCQRLDMLPVTLNDLNRESTGTSRVVGDEVARCDVFILLVGHRYGSRPAGQRLSHLEIEYKAAMSRIGLPVLAFIADPGFPWVPTDIDQGADAKALAAFKDRLRATHRVADLTSVVAFRERLLIELTQLQHAPQAPMSPAGAAQAIVGRDTVPRSLARQQAAQRLRVKPTAPDYLAVPPYVPGAPFTGRTSELAALDEWARSDDPVMVVEAIPGTGKSALAWEWAHRYTQAAGEELSGCLWWSSYDRAAPFTRFLQEVLQYVSALSADEVRRLDPAELSEQVFDWLRRGRYLVIIDSLEQFVPAYHDIEAGQDTPSLNEPNGEEFLHSLAAASPSKILITTQLMPAALRGHSGQALPGVRHVELPGLTDEDIRTLLSVLGVQGSEQAITGFFQDAGNHPLLAGVVAGLVRDYRYAPGDFDRWLADPSAGGDLSVSALRLTRRGSHILVAAWEGLDPAARKLLGHMSALNGAISWDTLSAINPFLPEPQGPVEPDLDEQTIVPVSRARSRLDAALKSLEDRGLLSWNRASNTYSVHPIIRGYAYDQLGDADRVQANSRAADHFQSQPTEDVWRATGPADLARTIGIFRALVGAGQFAEANRHWTSFGDTLLVNAGAYTTVVDLLERLGERASVEARADLALAYFHLARYQDAIRLDTAILGEVLRAGPVIAVENALSRLGSSFLALGEVVKAERCEELRASLASVYGGASNGNSFLKRAVHALARGLTIDAGELIGQAIELGPAFNTPWFSDSVTVERLRLAYYAGDRITVAKMQVATARVRSEAYRRRLADLQCLLAIRDDTLDVALAAAERHDMLTRAAGLEVVPARVAFLLARLGRTDEATAAARDATAKLPRSSGRRPYRYYFLARALLELGREEEAAEYAIQAYRQAWADGPPNHFHWDLQDARRLLNDMGKPLPELPTISPASVQIPLEDEVRVLTQELRDRRKER